MCAPHVTATACHIARNMPSQPRNRRHHREAQAQLCAHAPAETQTQSPARLETHQWHMHELNRRRNHVYQHTYNHRCMHRRKHRNNHCDAVSWLVCDLRSSRQCIACGQPPCQWWEEEVLSGPHRLGSRCSRPHKRQMKRNTSH